MSITHGIYVMNFHSLRRIQTVQPVLTVTAHILEYIRNLNLFNARKRIAICANIKVKFIYLLEQ